MEKSNIKMTVKSSGPGPNLLVKLNDQTIWNDIPSSDPQLIDHTFSFNDNETIVLSIIMSGKLPEHTKIDNQGNIIDDVLINVSDIMLDGVNIDKLMWTLAEYRHNFNNTNESTNIEKFYGDLGCNGTVSIKFTTPTYVWLLENM